MEQQSHRHESSPPRGDRRITTWPRRFSEGDREYPRLRRRSFALLTAHRISPQAQESQKCLAFILVWLFVPFRFANRHSRRIRTATNLTLYSRHLSGWENASGIEID